MVFGTNAKVAIERWRSFKTGYTGYMVEDQECNRLQNWLRTGYKRLQIGIGRGGSQAQAEQGSNLSRAYVNQVEKGTEYLQKIEPRKIEGAREATNC